MLASRFIHLPVFLGRHVRWVQPRCALLIQPEREAGRAALRGHQVLSNGCGHQGEAWRQRVWRSAPLQVAGDPGPGARCVAINLADLCCQHLGGRAVGAVHVFLAAEKALKLKCHCYKGPEHALVSCSGPSLCQDHEHSWLVQSKHSLLLCAYLHCKQVNCTLFILHLWSIVQR